MSEEVLLELGFLTEEERDTIHAVISKDVQMRKLEQSRISRLRKELGDLKEDGLPEDDVEAKNDRYCARCQTYFGIIWNKGAFCPRCERKVCKTCRENTAEDGWMCILCVKIREVKAQSGAWFFQGQKAKDEKLFGSLLVRQSLRRFSGASRSIKQATEQGVGNHKPAFNTDEIQPRDQQHQNNIDHNGRTLNKQTEKTDQTSYNSNWSGDVKTGEDEQYSDLSDADVSDEGSHDDTSSPRDGSERSLSKEGESDSSESLESDHGDQTRRMLYRFAQENTQVVKKTDVVQNMAEKQTEKDQDEETAAKRALGEDADDKAAKSVDKQELHGISTLDDSDISYTPLPKFSIPNKRREQSVSEDSMGTLSGLDTVRGSTGTSLPESERSESDDPTGAEVDIMYNTQRKHDHTASDGDMLLEDTATGPEGVVADSMEGFKGINGTSEDVFDQVGVVKETAGTLRDTFEGDLELVVDTSEVQEDARTDQVGTPEINSKVSQDRNTIDTAEETMQTFDTKQATKSDVLQVFGEGSAKKQDHEFSISASDVIHTVIESAEKKRYRVTKQKLPHIEKEIELESETVVESSMEDESYEQGVVKPNDVNDVFRNRDITEQMSDQIAPGYSGSPEDQEGVEVLPVLARVKNWERISTGDGFGKTFDSPRSLSETADREVLRSSSNVGLEGHVNVNAGLAKESCDNQAPSAVGGRGGESESGVGVESDDDDVGVEAVINKDESRAEDTAFEEHAGNGELDPEQEKHAGNGELEPEPEKHAGNGELEPEPEKHAGNGELESEPEKHAGNGELEPEPEKHAGNGELEPEPEKHAGNGELEPEPEKHAGNGEQEPEPEKHAGNGEQEPEPEKHAGNGELEPEPEKHAGNGELESEPEKHAGNGNDSDNEITVSGMSKHLLETISQNETAHDTPPYAATSETVGNHSQYEMQTLPPDAHVELEHVPRDQVDVTSGEMFAGDRVAAPEMLLRSEEGTSSVDEVILEGSTGESRGPAEPNSEYRSSESDVPSTNSNVQVSKNTSSLLPSDTFIDYESISRGKRDDEARPGDESSSLKADEYEANPGDESSSLKADEYEAGSGDESSSLEAGEPLERHGNETSSIKVPGVEALQAGDLQGLGDQAGYVHQDVSHGTVKPELDYDDDGTINSEVPTSAEESSSLDSRESALRAFSQTFASSVQTNHGLTPRDDLADSHVIDHGDDRRSSDPRHETHGVFNADDESNVSETSGYVTPTRSEGTSSKRTPSISGDEGASTPTEHYRRHAEEAAPVIITTEVAGSTKSNRSSIVEYEDDLDVSFSKYEGGLGNRMLKDQLSMGSRESIMSYYSNAGGDVYGKYPVTGEIYFGIKYDAVSQEFQIQVHQARDIAAVDEKNRVSDPYVKTYLLPDRSTNGKRKSKVKKNTINPVFDEVITYKMSYDNVLRRTLWLAVWNYDRFGHNDFLGEVLLPIDQYQQSGFSLEDPEPQWYHLCERQGDDPLMSYNGDIVLALKYVPASALVSKKKKKKKKGEEEKGELHINIIEANNLMGKDSNGFSDPFCKSYLLPDKSKKTKQKTAVVKKSLNPKWNYRFVYDNISLEELMDKVLELTVWDFDRGSSNEFLGGVRLGLGTGLKEWDDSNTDEQAAWNKMLNNQNDWNQVTLTLRDNMGNHK